MCASLRECACVSVCRVNQKNDADAQILRLTACVCACVCGRMRQKVRECEFSCVTWRMCVRVFI